MKSIADKKQKGKSTESGGAPQKTPSQTIQEAPGGLFSYRGYTSNQKGVKRRFLPLETALVLHGDNPGKEDPYKIEPLSPAEGSKQKGPGKYKPGKASTVTTTVPRKIKK